MTGESIDFVKLAGVILGLWGASLSTYIFVDNKMLRISVKSCKGQSWGVANKEIAVSIENNGSDAFLSTVSISGICSSRGRVTFSVEQENKALRRHEVYNKNYNISMLRSAKIILVSAIVNGVTIQSSHSIHIE